MSEATPVYASASDPFLEQLRREGRPSGRGYHRIYLGMAPGVGKTYAALLELHRLQSEGIDVVVAYVETYRRPKTEALLQGLPIIPRKRCSYQGVIVEEMDLDAVLKRKPTVALVDELAHTNVPGCGKHEKRWEDVQELLDAGISVFSTLNIQHIESLADIVESITGVLVRERVPDRIVDEADEVILIDLTPQALRQRLLAGEIYPLPQAQQALRNFFQEGNLTALRELALRKLATRVERDLQVYMYEQEIETVWPAGERIMVAIDAHPRAQHLIRRGWRLIQRTQSDLFVIFVETPEWSRADPHARRSLDDALRLAVDFGATIIRVPGRDVPRTLLQAAHDHNIDLLIVGQTPRSGWRRLLRRTVAERLLTLSTDIDILVVLLDSTTAP